MPERLAKPARSSTGSTCTADRKHRAGWGIGAGGSLPPDCYGLVATGDEKTRLGYRDGRLFAGVATYLSSFVVYTAGIRNGELTVLYPMVSLGYVWTLLWSRIFFKEPLTKGKFMGLGLILAGICVLNLGNR